MSEIQGKPVYGICECKEKRQVLSVEQATDLIQQMAANNWQVPTDYIPKTSVNGIVEQHYGDELKVWVGTQAEYDALTDEEKTNCFAIISDDPAYNEIQTLLSEYGQNIKSINSNVTNIYERLRKLGFREGSVIASPLVTATQNELKRQGNYVIGQYNGSLYLTGEMNEYLGVLPEDFRPTASKIDQNIVLYSEDYGWGSLSIYSSDGEMYVFIRPGISVTGNTINFEINLGYEATPIEIAPVDEL